MAQIQTKQTLSNSNINEILFNSDVLIDSDNDGVAQSIEDSDRYSRMANDNFVTNEDGSVRLRYEYHALDNGMLIRTAKATLREGNKEVYYQYTFLNQQLHLDYLTEFSTDITSGTAFSKTLDQFKDILLPNTPTASTPATETTTATPLSRREQRAAERKRKEQADLAQDLGSQGMPAEQTTPENDASAPSEPTPVETPVPTVQPDVTSRVIAPTQSPPAAENPAVFPPAPGSSQKWGETNYTTTETTITDATLNAFKLIKSDAKVGDKVSSTKAMTTAYVGQDSITFDMPLSMELSYVRFSQDRSDQPNRALNILSQTSFGDFKRVTFYVDEPLTATPPIKRFSVKMGEEYVTLAVTVLNSPGAAAASNLSAIPNTPGVDMSALATIQPPASASSIGTPSLAGRGTGLSSGGTIEHSAPIERSTNLPPPPVSEPVAVAAQQSDTAYASLEPQVIAMRDAKLAPVLGRYFTARGTSVTGNVSITIGADGRVETASVDLTPNNAACERSLAREIRDTRFTLPSAEADGAQIEGQSLVIQMPITYTVS